MERHRCSKLDNHPWLDCGQRLLVEWALEYADCLAISQLIGERRCGGVLCTHSAHLLLNTLVLAAFAMNPERLNADLASDLSVGVAAALCEDLVNLSTIQSRKRSKNFRSIQHNKSGKGVLLGRFERHRRILALRRVEPEAPGIMTVART